MKPSFNRFCLALAAAGSALVAQPALADGLSDDDPIARFNKPVCPAVTGLRTEVAIAIVTRIRENAENLGLELGEVADCEPNLVLIVLEDGQTYLDSIAAERGELFQGLTQAEKRAILEQDSPGRAWVRSQTLSRDGHAVGVRQNLEEIPQTIGWSAHSRIYSPVREDIIGSMIFVDSSAIEGATIGQIADYATLRGLSGRQPRGEDWRDASILALFDGDIEAAPQTLTEADAGFLEALYGELPNLPATLVFREARERAGMSRN